MKFAYTEDGTVTGLNRAGQEGELTGNCTPQELVWGMDVEAYSVVDEVFTPMSAEEHEAYDAQKAKETKLVADLTAVDVWVVQERAKNFEYDGHMYYPDADSLNALITTMPYKPEDFTMNWKTADLEADGISNIYVLLDKTGIIALGMTLELRQGTVWAQGDAKKKQIKEEYNS